MIYKGENVLYNPTQINKKLLFIQIFQNHLTLQVTKSLARGEFYTALAYR